MLRNGAKDSTTPSASMAHEGYLPQSESVQQETTHIHSVCTLITTISLIWFWTFRYRILITGRPSEKEWSDQRDTSVISIGKASLRAGPSVSRSQASSWNPATVIWGCLVHKAVSCSGSTYYYLGRQFGPGGSELSDISTPKLYIPLGDLFSKFLIVFWSKLMAEGDENKLWPIFWALPLSSSSLRHQSVVHRKTEKRSEKWELEV